MNDQDKLKLAREALEDVANPIAAMQRDLPEGCKLNGHTAIRASESPQHYKGIAEKALAAINAPSTEQLAGQLPERDASKPAETQGMFQKFRVQRLDGSDCGGGKHYGCRYFVLDLDHDPHAKPAMRAYASACVSTHPQLSAELAAEFGTEQPAAASVDGLMDGLKFEEMLDTYAKRPDRFNFHAIVGQVRAWGAQQREAGRNAWHATGTAVIEQWRTRAIAAEKERDDLLARLPLLQEQANAWLAVAKALGEVSPECWGRYPTGMECAVKAIEQWGSQLARPADLAGLTPVAGHCERGRGCVCGGDTKRVREGCGHWVNS